MALTFSVRSLACFLLEYTKTAARVPKSAMIVANPVTLLPSCINQMPPAIATKDKIKQGPHLLR